MITLVGFSGRFARPLAAGLSLFHCTTPGNEVIRPFATFNTPRTSDSSCCRIHQMSVHSEVKCIFRPVFANCSSRGSGILEGTLILWSLISTFLINRWHTSVVADATKRTGNKDKTRRSGLRLIFQSICIHRMLGSFNSSDNNSLTKSGRISSREKMKLP